MEQKMGKLEIHYDENTHFIDIENTTTLNSIYINEKELELLIEQRNRIIDSIIMFTKTFHTSIFSILTLITAVATLVIDSKDFVNSYYIFAIIQVVFALILFIYGLLIGTNNDREYIRAIDEYISIRFRIKGLFYQGNLSYRHISRNDSQLSKITLPGGTAVAFFIIAMGIFGTIMYNRITFFDIVPFLSKHLFNSIENIVMSVIVIVEILIIVILLLANFYYKATGKSQFYDELLFYLNTGGFKEKARISEKIFKTIRGYKKFENVFKIEK